MAGSSVFNLISICFIVFLLSFPKDVISRTLVRHLPGFDGPLPFELETGYVSVDEINGVEFFYYFVKSENNPVDDPLILWLTGGPACSTLTAFAMELGPVLLKHVKYDGSLPGLEINPYSWTKVSNIIFLDSPVATGFSYSTTPEGYHSTNTLFAKQVTTFLKKWLNSHKSFISNRLYVGGDSYSGLVVPVVVQNLSNEEKSFPNLKGYILGNPVTDRVLEKNFKVPFLRGMGILSRELFESVENNCGADRVNVLPSNMKCIQDLQAVSECSSRLYDQHILDLNCVTDSPDHRKLIRDKILLEENLTDFVLRSPPLEPGFECMSYRRMLSYYWANDNQVQKALNIKPGTIKEWVRCSSSNLHFFQDVNNGISYHLNLSEKGRYRSLIYSGDHDMIVPFMSTEEWIRSLNYAISDEWRPWLVDDQITGYTRTYTNNMTFTTVKGSGHIAPEYTPRQCLTMVQRWLSYEPL